jgi:hypothetical protein
MSRNLTASDRSSLIRLASTLPVGSAERKAILAGLRRSAALTSDQYIRLEVEIDRVFGGDASIEIMDDDSEFDRNAADLVIRIGGVDVSDAPQMLRALENSALIEKPGSSWDVERVGRGDMDAFLFRANLKNFSQVPVVEADAVLDYVRRLWGNSFIRLSKSRKPGVVSEINTYEEFFIEKKVRGQAYFMPSIGGDYNIPYSDPDTTRTERVSNSLSVQFTERGVIDILGETPFEGQIRHRSRDGFDQRCKKTLNDILAAWNSAHSRALK